jgi:hypothetical protein
VTNQFLESRHDAKHDGELSGDGAWVRSICVDREIFWGAALQPFSREPPNIVAFTTSIPTKNAITST